VEFSVDGNGVRSYRFLGTEIDPSILVLSITPTTNDQHILEDLDTFEGILTQYSAEVRGRTHPSQPTTATRDGSVFGDLRGQLVLINEDNGEVVGQVDKKFNIREDPRLHEKGRENEPVVIEVPDDDDLHDDGTPLEVFARYVPPGEEDWITKSATVVSHAISATTNLLVTTITNVSTSYIANSKPGTPAPSASSSSNTPSRSSPAPSSQKPSNAVVFLTSASTRKGLSAVHAMSGQAVQVSTKTLSMVDGMIRRAMGGKAKDSSRLNLASMPSGTGKTPVPSRSPSPMPPPAYNEKPPLPSRANPSSSSLSTPNPSTTSSSGRSSPVPPPLPPRKLGTKAKLVLSADLVWSTLDNAAKQLLDVSSERIGAVVGHKYGPDAAETSNHITGTARNVALVYIDMRGIGRKALLRRAGKEFVKARMSSSESKTG